MQSGSLVANVVGGKALPPGLAAQIVARTDGVPLFVEELTKTILESGDLIVEGDRYVYAGSSANVTIPETLRNSLMARLDRVAVSKEIAQVGSVIGREFSYELIAGLELMSEEALADGLRHLTSSGLATCHGEIPNAVYKFSHALVQDAAYELAAEKQAQAAARRNRPFAGGALAGKSRGRLAPELLAFHYNAAEQYLRRRAAVAARRRSRDRALRLARSHHPFADRSVGGVETAAFQGPRPDWKSRCGPRSGRRWLRNAAGRMRRSAKRSNPPGGSPSRSTKAAPTCRS